jgi:hypothetical protein
MREMQIAQERWPMDIDERRIFDESPENRDIEFKLKRL